MSNAAFYLVYSPCGVNPQYRHETFDAAKREAERLAEKCHGKEFFVVKAMSVSRKLSVITEVLENLNDDGIPF